MSTVQNTHPATPGERELRIAQAAAAATWIDRAVLDVAQLEGDEATRVEPAWPGAQSTLVVPLPLPGLRAAVGLSNMARHAAVQQVTAAREAGHCWEEIAQAAGFDRAARDADVPLGEAAHNWTVTGSVDGEGPYRPGPYRSDAWTVTWRCPECGGLVRDRGPMQGHPVDAEPGHLTTCARLARATAAFEAALDAGADA